MDRGAKAVEPEITINIKQAIFDDDDKIKTFTAFKNLVVKAGYRFIFDKGTFFLINHKNNDIVIASKSPDDVIAHTMALLFDRDDCD